mgnify:CR=1 FL=1
MSDVLSLVGPVFALILLGLAAVRLRLLDTAALRGMTDVVFYAGLPALVALSIIQAPPLQVATIAGSFLGGAVLLFFVNLALARRLLGQPLANASVFALDSVYGNTGMLGIPVISAAYGPDGLAELMAIIAFHSAVLLPLATAFLEMGGSHQGSGRGSGPARGFWGVLRATLPGVARNPIVVAIVLAFAWRQLGIPLPAAPTRLLGMIAQAGTPMALFCLGATLPTPRGWHGLPEVALSCVLKLAVMPVVIGAIAWLAGVRGVAFSAVIVTAAMPTGANAFMLARRFETMLEASATTVLVATGVSMVTLTVLLGLLPR